MQFLSHHAFPTMARTNRGVHPLATGHLNEVITAGDAELIDITSIAGTGARSRSAKRKDPA
jgi:hypothetical protein